MKFITAWIASLIVVAIATFAYAQTRAPQNRVLSGNDVGFRVEGMDSSGKPSGVLVLRINGQWVEVGGFAEVRPVK
jgi:hypothetical protein